MTVGDIVVYFDVKVQSSAPWMFCLFVLGWKFSIDASPAILVGCPKYKFRRETTKYQVQ
jgi:hypothetical protein